MPRRATDRAEASQLKAIFSDWKIFAHYCDALNGGGVRAHRRGTHGPAGTLRAGEAHTDRWDPRGSPEPTGRQNPYRKAAPRLQRRRGLAGAQKTGIRTAIETTGHVATENRNAPVFPEHTMGFIIDELDR